MPPIKRLYHGAQLIYEAPALTGQRPDAQLLTLMLVVHKDLQNTTFQKLRAI